MLPVASCTMGAACCTLHVACRTQCSCMLHVCSMQHLQSLRVLFLAAILQRSPNCRSQRPDVEGLHLIRLACDRAVRTAPSRHAQRVWVHQPDSLFSHLPRCWPSSQRKSMCRLCTNRSGFVRRLPLDNATKNTVYLFTSSSFVDVTMNICR